MKSRSGKTLRRESAIERLKATVAAHEAGVELTTRILEDKKIFKTEDETGETIGNGIWEQIVVPTESQDTLCCIGSGKRIFLIILVVSKGGFKSEDTG